jgi:hypothetical protein
MHATKQRQRIWSKNDLAVLHAIEELDESGGGGDLVPNAATAASAMEVENALAADAPALTRKHRGRRYLLRSWGPSLAPVELEDDDTTCNTEKEKPTVHHVMDRTTCTYNQVNCTL